MTEQSTALALHTEHSALQLAYEPRNFAELKDACITLFQSRLLPKAITSVEAAVYIAVRGRELGLSLGQSFAAIHIIDGKTVLSGDLIAARVRRSKACKSWRIVKFTSEEVAISTQRHDDSEPTTLSWTMADAKRAGLDSKDNWRKFPRAMLRARCSAELARAVYPEEALGMYDPDELPSVANDNAAAVARVEYDVAIVDPAPPVSAPAAPEAVKPKVVHKRNEMARIFAERLRAATGVDEVSVVWADVQTFGFGPAVFEKLTEIYDQRMALIAEAEDPPPEAS